MGSDIKELMVDEITERLTSQPNLYVSSFINIDAESLNNLREKLDKKNSKYFVVKNRLCRIALKKADIDELTDLVDGPTGFVLCGEEGISISKILVDFSKDVEGFSIKGAYVDGEFLEEEQVKELASLPSRKGLLTMVTCAVKSPVTQFANVLRQCIKGLVISLNEISKQRTEDRGQKTEVGKSDF